MPARRQQPCVATQTLTVASLLLSVGKSPIRAPFFPFAQLSSTLIRPAGKLHAAGPDARAAEGVGLRGSPLLPPRTLASLNAESWRGR